MGETEDASPKTGMRAGLAPRWLISNILWIYQLKWLAPSTNAKFLGPNWHEMIGSNHQGLMQLNLSWYWLHWPMEWWVIAWQPMACSLEKVSVHFSKEKDHTPIWSPAACLKFIMEFFFFFPKKEKDCSMGLVTGQIEWKIKIFFLYIFILSASILVVSGWRTHL